MDENRMEEIPAVPMPTGLSQQEHTASEQQILSQDPGLSEENIQPVNPSKSKYPCLYCAKNCASGAIQCTICTLWAHRACTKLSKEAIKGLEVQAKEVGLAYWACRSCLSFKNK